MIQTYPTGRYWTHSTQRPHSRFHFRHTLGGCNSLRVGSSVGFSVPHRKPRNKRQIFPRSCISAQKKKQWDSCISSYYSYQPQSFVVFITEPTQRLGRWRLYKDSSSCSPLQWHAFFPVVPKSHRLRLGGFECISAFSKIKRCDAAGGSKFKATSSWKLWMT